MMNLRIIPEFEKNSALVDFVQTVIGKLVILSIFSLLIKDVYPAKLIIPSLFIVTFLPQFRRIILCITSAAMLLMAPIFHFYNLNAKALGIENFNSRPIAHLPEIILAFTLMFAFYTCVKKYGKTKFLKRPITAFFVFVLSIIFAAYYLPLPGNIKMFLWIMISVLVGYTWHFCYSLMDIKNKKAEPLVKQTFHYFSLWGASATPYAKGSAYLRKIEAKDSRSLAVSQIKGLKLILWSHVLKIMMSVISLFSYSQMTQSSSVSKGLESLKPIFIEGGFLFKFSTLLELINAFKANENLSLLHIWPSLIIHFILFIMAFAIAGHIVIAICRFAGFNALRNTYSPMSSVSVADFWNRYYFYFKELLVDIFFYPAFLRYFKKHPKLRMFFATFCAAGFGNFFYHYFYELDHIMTIGPIAALIKFKHYFFYSVFLAFGISFSQLRHSLRAKKKMGHADSLFSKLISLSLIFLFFIIAFTYHDLGEHFSELERLKFFTYILGF